MPNWCENEVTIAGPAADVVALVEAVAGEGPFDFNKIVPMPEELRQVCSGFCTINGEKVTAWYEIKSDEGEMMKIPANTDNLRALFGFEGWYDFACAKWGTKWNASEAERVDLTATKPGQAAARFAFNTAWSPPEPVLKALAEQWPTIAVKLDWWEGGMCQRGSSRWRKGKLVSQSAGEYRGSRGG